LLLQEKKEEKGLKEQQEQQQRQYKEVHQEEKNTKNANIDDNKANNGSTLIKRGAEADIYLTTWYGKIAISKIRTPKPYRHEGLDRQIRKQRTIHEAKMISSAKLAGVASPFVYFVDSINAEIIMEYVKGNIVKDVIESYLCNKMGVYTALLHKNNIIHGDLTTSNFIASIKRNKDNNGTEKMMSATTIVPVLLDFGLSYYSTRIEDRAVDIRLIKQVFSSAHILTYDDAYDSFIKGYSDVAGEKKTIKILENVAEIEQRGRYARVI
jgi:TP53 regulating kinase and related kinases